MWARSPRSTCPRRRVTLVGHEVTTSDAGATVTAQLLVDGEHVTVTGEGNGPIAAFVHALQRTWPSTSTSSTTPSTPSAPAPTPRPPPTSRPAARTGQVGRRPRHQDPRGLVEGCDQRGQPAVGPAAMRPGTWTFPRCGRDMRRWISIPVEIAADPAPGLPQIIPCVSIQNALLSGCVFRPIRRTRPFRG